MKLKFVDQPYQTDAVNAICDIFDGCEVKDSLFTIEVDNRNKLNFDTEGVDYFRLNRYIGDLLIYSTLIMSI